MRCSRRWGNAAGDSDQLEVWDEALVRLGAQIILWRIEAVQQIERFASRVHHELTRGTEILRLAYEPAFDPLPKPNGQLGLKIGYSRGSFAVWNWMKSKMVFARA